MELIESKSLLAKLMATENLTVEQRSVQTASFDVKNRILTIPTLDKKISSQLYDLFTGHEVGHALYTPLDGLMRAKDLSINMNVANVVEDSRIERKIKYKYPGLKNSFAKAYQELMEKDFFGVKDTDMNKLNFLDRINLHCKGGAALRIQFSEEERNILNEVESTESYDEVIDVSKKIVEYMKAKIEEEEKKRLKAKAEDSESGDDDYDEFEETDDFDDGDSSEEDSDSEQDKDSEDGEESSKKPKVSSATDSAKDGNQRIEDKIRSFTDENFKKNENRLFESTPDQYLYVNVPETDPKMVFDHKELWKLYKNDGHATDAATYLQLRSESNKVVSYLVKEFEMRKNADQLKRATTAKTGDLDMKKLFSYGFSEDIFKKISVVPGGKSHGLVLFLDWSGSMAEHMGNTFKQLINLVLFCKKVNIPYEVYAFADESHDQYTQTPKAKANDLALKSYALLNLLSSRMSSLDFTYAASALTAMSGLSRNGAYSHKPYWMSMQGTPLNEAIIHAMSIVPDFQKKNKLQVVNTIFLTDGEGRDIREHFQMQSGYGLRRYFIKAGTLVIRDPLTKHEERINLKVYHQNQQTKALIKLLKYRTNSNVIGFYVISSRDYNRKVYSWYPTSTNHEDLKLSFRKDNYTILENSGYDEYYILRSNGLDTDDAGTFEVKENSTSRGIVAAFAKYSGGRFSSRVILNRFIGLIT